MAYSDIKDPSAHFQTATYTGTGSTQSITNDGNSDMQPDWVWVKSRSGGSSHHVVFDSSRGVNNRLIPNLNIDEDTGDGYGTVSAFNSDGFSVTNGLNTGNNTATYVGWQWKANGGTTTSKSSGTVAGNVTTPCVQQVNTDAGFSIITYTASTSYAGTETHLEHGLGVGPRFLIVKRRDTAADWAVYHADNGGSPNAGYSYNVLNSNAATAQSSPTNKYWLNTPAESNATLLAFGLENGADGGEYVCYAFAEKQGYSKFGKYVGNSSADGPFVYTGFKPAFLIVKKTTAAGADWRILDSTRNPFNLTDLLLNANGTNAESDGSAHASNIGVDFLSNGFKVRTTYAHYNGANDFIYMAFAENPFVAGGIPTTAR
jgi:hypothetical protein